MRRRSLVSIMLTVAMLLFVFTTAGATWARGLLIPARIGGQVFIEGAALTQATDDGFTFEVTRTNGTSFGPAAVDDNGVSADGWYVIDIPIYDADLQPGGAQVGETVVIHVNYDGPATYSVTSPSRGRIVVGAEGSVQRVDLTAYTRPIDPPAPTAPEDPEDPEDPAAPAAPAAPLVPADPEDPAEPFDLHPGATALEATAADGGTGTAASTAALAEDDAAGGGSGATGATAAEKAEAPVDASVERRPVHTVTLDSGDMVGLTVDSGGSLSTFSAIDPADIADTEGRPDDLRYGLFDLDIEVDTPGDTVFVTLQLPEAAPEGYAWYKYSPQLGWYDFSDFAVFSADRTRVTLELTDGGAGDDDNVINGVIKDPSGLGTTRSANVSTSQTGGADSKACFIETIVR